MKHTNTFLVKWGKCIFLQELITQRNSRQVCMISVPQGNQVSQHVLVYSFVDLRFIHFSRVQQSFTVFSFWSRLFCKPRLEAGRTILTKNQILSPIHLQILPHHRDLKKCALSSRRISKLGWSVGTKSSRINKEANVQNRITTRLHNYSIAN